MVSDSHYIIPQLSPDRGLKLRTEQVRCTGKHKILPYDQSILIAPVKEIIVRVKASAPDAYRTSRRFCLVFIESARCEGSRTAVGVQSASICGARIVFKRASLERCCAVRVHPAAVFTALIVSNRAVFECEVAVVVDSAAAQVGRIAADRAVRDRGGALVVDACSAGSVRDVVGNGHVRKGDDTPGVVNSSTVAASIA